MRKTLVLLVFLTSCGKEPPPPAPPPPPPPQGPDKVIVIARAQGFAPKDYLVPGHVTVLEFYLHGNKECEKAAPQVEAAVKSHEKAILRRVELGNWNSNATDQARREFGLVDVPLVCVFDGKGALVEKLKASELGKLEAAVRQALSR